MKRIIYLCIFILCQLINNTHAQTNTSTASDLKRISQILNKHRYSYRLTYTLYHSYRSLKPVETQVLDVKMWDMMINIKNKYFQVVKNQKQYLYIDPVQKTLMLNNVEQYSQDLNELKQIENLLSIDTILSLYTKIEVLKPLNDSKGYRFHIKPGSEYAYSDVIFNTKTGFPEKIVLYYTKNLDELIGPTEAGTGTSEPPRLEMGFSNFVEAAFLNEEAFSINPFLVKEGKKITPTATYKDYTFINNTY